jgi:hypothetical protein
MVSLGLPIEIIEIERNDEGLIIKMTSELVDGSEEAQPDFHLGHSTKPMHWCYKVPFPGVRYYDYEE